MQKAVMLLILLLGMINLVPPMFAEGGTFDMTYYALNECGEKKLYHGLYFDNVYYTLVYLSCTFSSFLLPLFLSRKYKYVAWCSFGMGAWFLSGLAFELINFASPEFIYNSDQDRLTYTKYVIAFVFLIGSLTTHEAWIKQKKLEK
jgi:hypothetical protein